MPFFEPFRIPPFPTTAQRLQLEAAPRRCQSSSISRLADVLRTERVSTKAGDKGGKKKLLTVLQTHEKPQRRERLHSDAAAEKQTRFQKQTMLEKANRHGRTRSTSKEYSSFCLLANKNGSGLRNQEQQEPPMPVGSVTPAEPGSGLHVLSETQIVPSSKMKECRL